MCLVCVFTVVSLPIYSVCRKPHEGHGIILLLCTNYFKIALSSYTSHNCWKAVTNMTHLTRTFLCAEVSNRHALQLTYAIAVKHFTHVFSRYSLSNFVKILNMQQNAFSQFLKYKSMLITRGMVSNLTFLLKLYVRTCPHNCRSYPLAMHPHTCRPSTK